MRAVAPEPDVYEDNAVDDGAAEEADARLLGVKKPPAKKQKQQQRGAKAEAT